MYIYSLSLSLCVCVCMRERSPKSVSEKMFTKQDSDDFLNNFSLQRTDKSHKFFVVCVSRVSTMRVFIM